MLRTCVGCSQTDDHPRHDEILQLAPELIVASWHKDCCAIIKNCELCRTETAGADGKTGDDMRAHVVAHYAGKAEL